MEAIKLVMKNNKMKSRDIFPKQMKGMAMGMSPSPPIANLRIAIYKNENVLGTFDDCISFLRCFIDDGFEVWTHNLNPAVDATNWARFKKVMSESGLQWIFLKHCRKSIFMDMRIEIKKGKTVTSLYAKPLALYLYIPPHSCHAPGLLSALIFGMTFRIFHLRPREEDVDRELTLFMQRLLDRGYTIDSITLKVSKAIKNAQKHLARSEGYTLQLKKVKEEASNTQVYFHLPFNSSHPMSVIKRDWQILVF